MSPKNNILQFKPKVVPVSEPEPTPEDLATDEMARSILEMFRETFTEEEIEAWLESLEEESDEG